MDNQEALYWFKEYSRIDGHSPNHKPSLAAIAALEKQIPMKPVCIEDKMWTCGRCQNNLMFKWSRYPDILMPKEAGGTYCMECGQKIDWSVIQDD